MSIEATSHVLGLSMGRGNGIRKLILLGYANHADKFGRAAYPSAQTVADYAECDSRTVQRHVGWLIANGYLCEGDQRAVSHIDPRYRPIVYDVAMGDQQVEQWAAEAGRATGTRSRSAEAGRRGGRASAQLSRGDNLSPQAEQEPPQVTRGDNLSPLDRGPRGDNTSGSGVTNLAVRGDTGVTRTVLEPPREPSSSPALDAAAPATAPAPPAGGRSDQPPLAALEVLPESIRDHPSVIPAAIERRLQALDELGWPRAEIRTRLAGVETADKPGAAALARLTSLNQVDPPSPVPARPRWCGNCDQRTRMREDADRDDRPYPCPHCHPRTTPPRPASQKSSNTSSVLATAARLGSPAHADDRTFASGALCVGAAPGPPHPRAPASLRR